MTGPPARIDKFVNTLRVAKNKIRWLGGLRSLLKSKPNKNDERLGSPTLRILDERKANKMWIERKGIKAAQINNECR